MLHVRQVINNVFASNTFLISQDDGRDVWLVDIGDYDKVASILPSDAKVRGLLLTHTHFDHIYGINELCMNHPECVVYTSEYGHLALKSAKKNFSFYHEHPIEFNGGNVFVLKEGDILTLFQGISLSVYSTPGHCPSCLTYITENCIFTGDAYIPGVAVVSKLPRGNKELSLLSKERIIQLSLGKVIFPGHGSPVTSDETSVFTDLLLS